MEKAVAVDTCLGVLHGRDCVYLDLVRQDDRNNMIFIGEINGDLVSKNRYQKDFIPYTLTFKRVLACFSCELDSYENLDGSSWGDGSDFDIIENSEWLQSFPIRKDFDKGNYNHYRLFTYDVVYNIIAVSHSFDINI